jgi:hypothetical protein
MTSEFPPIACALGLGDFKDRIGWIRELSARRSGAIVGTG